MSAIAARASGQEFRRGLRGGRGAAAWGAGALLLLLGTCLALRDLLPAIQAPPPELRLPLAEAINEAVAWFAGWAKPVFRAIADVIGFLLDALVALFLALPWIVALALATLTGWAAGGRSLALFAAGAVLYMNLAGYWSQSLNTLAMICVAVLLAAGFGTLFGVLLHRAARLRPAVEPLLDLMQTVPTFAYLIPLLVLFGFGPTTGIVASAIFALPPMVRNVALGLDRVPREPLEAARMSGASAWQSFRFVQVPAALPQILLGFNQTVMAALSMTIVSALSGGIADIGFEVLKAMRKAHFGQSLLSGLVIVLIAVLLDRLAKALVAVARRAPRSGGGRRRFALALVVPGLALLWLLATLVPALERFPRDWVPALAEPINASVLWLTAQAYDALAAIKTGTLFLILLPLKVGFSQSVSPYFWGFEPGPALWWSYWVLAGAAVLVLLLRGRPWQSALLTLLACVLFWGCTGMPWVAMLGSASLLAWRAAGRRAGLLVLASLLFLVLGGVWERAMVSLALVGAGVVLAFSLGFALGVLASRVQWLSRLLRPLCDSFQTLPAFVYLVPVIMLFLLGEFSALVAIVVYATIPAIRYTEHGLSQVAQDRIEAARAMGCSETMLLWWVRLPLALPEILLGLNQTVMFALSMLVIAAIIGEAGLGQLVYLALIDGNVGQGLVAGLGIALLAISIDRTLRGLALRHAAGEPPGGEATP